MPRSIPIQAGVIWVSWTNFFMMIPLYWLHVFLMLYHSFWRLVFFGTFINNLNDYSRQKSNSFVTVTMPTLLLFNIIKSKNQNKIYLSPNLNFNLKKKTTTHVSKISVRTCTKCLWGFTYKLEHVRYVIISDYLHVSWKNVKSPNKCHPG